MNQQQRRKAILNVFIAANKNEAQAALEWIEQKKPIAFGPSRPDFHLRSNWFDGQGNP